jgi:tryptophanyl-tRNA synthetase
MIESLAPIRARREEIERDRSIVWDALRQGNQLARERAAETLEAVREAMQITYPELHA